MKKENLNTVNSEVEKVYEFINNFVSNHGLDMIDLAYPNHDGVQDADVVSDMMLLRQSANSLSKACNILVKKTYRRYWRRELISIITIQPSTSRSSQFYEKIQRLL